VDLKGKLVVVTGAANGIGRAFALEFLSRGCRVLALDMNAAGLDALKAAAATDKLETLTADVSDRAAYHAALDRALGERAPDVFINNAGIARAGSLLDTGMDAAEKTLRVNLDGVISGTYHALRRMQPGGHGTIVNIASMAGHVPSPYLSAYAASKHGVVGFTRSLRAELRQAGSGIRLCLVSPSFIDTAIMRQPGYDFPSWLKWSVGSPEGVARRVADGVARGCEEIFPHFGGWLLRLGAVLPEFLLRIPARILIKSSKAAQK